MEGLVAEASPVQPGQIVSGPLFNEPMRAETVQSNGPASWVLGLVGTRSERFRRVTLTDADLETLTILDAIPQFTGDGNLLRLGLQAYSLGIVTCPRDRYHSLSRSGDQLQPGHDGLRRRRSVTK